jgi:hypothetical protein
MSRAGGNLPSHRWLVGQDIMRTFAWLFIISSLVTFITLWSIAYSIRRDCRSPYRRNMKLFGYWIHIDAGSTKDGCIKP